MAENRKCYECHFFQPEDDERRNYCYKRHITIKHDTDSCMRFVDVDSINKHKADFVNELKILYMKNAKNPMSFEDMEYINDTAGEWVKVTFKTGGVKRFSVAADSEQGILIDFAKFLKNFNDYQWEI